MQMQRHQCRAVCTDSEETGMAQRNLPRIADKNVESHGKDNIDQNHIDQINIVGRNIKRESEEKDEEK